MEAAKQSKINMFAEFQPFIAWRSNISGKFGNTDSQRKSDAHYAGKQTACLKKLSECYLREHRSKARLNISKQKLSVRIMPGNSVLSKKAFFPVVFPV
jgi:hypothetical protein